MKTRVTVKGSFTAATILFFAAIPCASIAWQSAGFSGGRIVCSLDGRSYAIAIPDSFTIADANTGFAGRLLVTATAKNTNAATGRERYLSELWMFTPPDSVGIAISFGDRRTLLSLQTEFGERARTCARTVNCANAIALLVDLWEGSEVLLFDRQGIPVEFERKAIARACGCAADYVRPIAWVPSGNNFTLVASVGDEGGPGPFLMLYNFESGEVTAEPAESAWGELGDRVLSNLD